MVRGWLEGERSGHVFATTALGFEAECSNGARLLSAPVAMRCGEALLLPSAMRLVGAYTQRPHAHPTRSCSRCLGSVVPPPLAIVADTLHPSRVPTPGRRLQMALLV